MGPRITVVRFARQQDEIVVWRDLVACDGVDRPRHVPERTLHHKPALLQLVGPFLPDQERHLCAGLQEPGSVVAAKRSGPEHEDLHGDLL